MHASHLLGSLTGHTGFWLPSFAYQRRGACTLHVMLHNALCATSVHGCVLAHRQLASLYNICIYRTVYRYMPGIRYAYCVSVLLFNMYRIHTGGQTAGPLPLRTRYAGRAHCTLRTTYCMCAIGAWLRSGCAWGVSVLAVRGGAQRLRRSFR